MRRSMQVISERIAGVQGEMRKAFRGVLNFVKSTPVIQQGQVSGLADEHLQDVELMQQFGFTSVPPQGTDAVILPIGGSTSYSVIIATEHGQFRVKSLKSGEVAIYDQSGSVITLKQGKVIDIQCDCLTINATQKVDITTPILKTSQILTAGGQINGNGGMAIQGGNGARFSGDVTQTSGSFSTSGEVTANGIALSTHKHRGDSGGETSSPH